MMKSIIKIPRIKIRVYLAVCIGLCAIATSIYFLAHIPRGYVKIAENIVDNSYNNLLAGGNLARIEDKIYYNYVRSDFAYGLVEISKDGSERIFWEGPKSGTYRLSHRIREHDGLLTMAFYDEIRAYFPDANTFEAYSPLNTVPEMTLLYQTVGEKMVYRQANNPQDKETVLIGNLAVYENGEARIIAGSKVDAFYVVGDAVYYHNAESYAGGEFRKYDFTDGTDVSVCKSDGYCNVFGCIVEEGHLIFRASKQGSEQKVYKVDLNSSEKTIETVCIEDVQSHNVYNGEIYVATNMGLAVYDVATNESRRLCDKAAEECYIIDDTWVYFVNEKKQLWRVAQSGGTAEKMFG